MTEIGVQYSTIDAPLQLVTESTMARRRKTSLITPSSPGNLFNHQKRNHKMQYSSVIPTISLSSFPDFKEKLIQMAANNKSVKQVTIRSPTPTEFRLKLPSPDISQTKPRLPSSSNNRPTVTNIPKSSLSYPTVIPRATTAHRTNNNNNNNYQQQQQGARFLYVLNTPVYSRRTNSARILNNNINNVLPLHQQPHLLTAPLSPRPHPQYGHFLAYLRRQSLARMRRKQQEDEAGDNIETTITFNPTRPSPLLFQSTSNVSLRTITSDASSVIPTLNLLPKRKNRLLSSYRFLQRSPTSIGTNSRLNINPSPSPLLKLPTPSPRLLTKKPSDEQLSVIITPTNSIIDETTISPIKKAPYELQLSGDMLNYCYVSESGVKYQGQLLSTSV